MRRLPLALTCALASAVAVFVIAVTVRGSGVPSPTDQLGASDTALRTGVDPAGPSGLNVDAGVPSPSTTDSSPPNVAAPSAAPLSAGQSVAAGWQIVIPAIRVDAPVVRMSVDGAGQMMTPSDGLTVAWYDFTAIPGGPGNAVMSGHVDWERSAAVFRSLHQLVRGDPVVVSLGGRQLRYEVESVRSVPAADADVSAILGARSGSETLTLITCGGTFDVTAGAYDRRVIVTARRI